MSASRVRRITVARSRPDCSAWPAGTDRAVPRRQRHHREVVQPHAVSPSTLFSDTLLTLHEAALVVFWNTSADTLGPAAAADALRELSDRATWASEYLDQYDIPVYATRATALVVRPDPGGGALR